jgi:hypothetical protein
MIKAQLATIPGREELVKQTINSLLPQVDVLSVICNGHNTSSFQALVGAYAHSSGVAFRLLDNSTGDGAKFLDIEKYKGYFFSCDDDLVYPPDYVSTTIKYLEEWGNVVVSHHGRKLKPRPIQSYYSPDSRIDVYRCLGAVQEHSLVDVGGTGVMAFHTDTVKGLRYEWFKEPNMADVWMGLWCEQHGIKILVPKHESGWIKYLEPEKVGSTIYNDYNNNDQRITAIWNNEGTFHSEPNKS